MNFVVKNILFSLSMLLALIFSTGCTGAEIMGTYMALAIAHPLLESCEDYNDHNKTDKTSNKVDNHRLSKMVANQNSRNGVPSTKFAGSIKNVETKTHSKSTISNLKKTQKIVPEKKSHVKHLKVSAVGPIIDAYKNLEWEKCLRLVATQVNSSDGSAQDHCTSRILAGAIHYQLGNTNAAQNYFISDCKVQNCPVVDLLSPEIIRFYQKTNSR